MVASGQSLIDRRWSVDIKPYNQSSPADSAFPEDLDVCASLQQQPTFTRTNSTDFALV